jgi:hypothetical protein
VVVAVRYWRDPSLLMITLAPQGAALVGYALFLGPLDHYYYIPVVPLAILTMAFAAAAPPTSRLARIAAAVLLVSVLSLVPERLRFAATMHRMPQYGALVEGSRKIARMTEPMRTILTDFELPTTSDPTFLYSILGGRIEPGSPWYAIISADGSVTYHRSTN